MKLIMKPIRISKNKLTTMMMLFIAVSCCSGKLFLSDATNDVYVGICGTHAVSSESLDWVTNNAPVRYDDGLAIMAFCRTGAVNLLVPLDKTIFIKFEMRDNTGKKVAETAEGKQWGSDIKHFPAEPGRNKHDRMSIWEARGPHTNGFSAFMSGPSLPAPKDLFEMTNSGIYYLTLEVRLMKQHMQTNGWTWTHIAIPPVTVKVERSPDTK
jgi:hypothetical protein